jgi:DNA-directed RNA polymerase specialized sigma24 family protein
LKHHDLCSEEVIRELKRFAVFFSLRHGLSAETGEDTLQDVLYRLLDDRKLLDRIERIEYVQRMIANRIRDARRHQRRFECVPLDSSFAAADACGFVSRKVFADDLRRLIIERLPEALDLMRANPVRQRAASEYVRRFLSTGKEPPYREVAAAVGTSIATVHRARKELQGALLKVGVSEGWQPTRRPSGK